MAKEVIQQVQKLTLLSILFYYYYFSSQSIFVVNSFSIDSLSDNNMIRSTAADTIMKLRVVSYNVLSSHLASPTHYTSLNPDHLDSKTRLNVILNKLDNEIISNKKSENNNNKCETIIALQEVSYDWAGSLHTFFANRGYHLITGLYGKSFNGYMGVALAYPVESFTCIDTNISRLSDTRIGGWPAKEKEQSTLQWLIRTPLKKLGLVTDEPECHWNMSKRRFNVIVGTTLQHKSTGITFCVANYHMPCAFYAPKAMTIHAEMAIRYVQEMAKKNEKDQQNNINNEKKSTKIPYILAGDFNLKPVDGVYKYLTTGNLNPDDPFFPTPPIHDPTFTWTPNIIESVNSAYAMFDKEPDFTNYSQVRDSDPFIDTLDYIFISPGIKVNDVQKLPNRNESHGPFPNLEINVNEPSDHILIAANLEIG